MFADSRDTPLEISLSAPLRSTSTLRATPVLSIERWKPAASASAPIRIATVSAMPTAVVSVEIGRWVTLRKL